MIFNKVLNWLVAASLNIIFKLYSDGASQFLKCFSVSQLIHFNQHCVSAPSENIKPQGFPVFLGVIEMEH